MRFLPCCVGLPAGAGAVVPDAVGVRGRDRGGAAAAAAGNLLQRHLGVPLHAAAAAAACAGVLRAAGVPRQAPRGTPRPLPPPLLLVEAAGGAARGRKVHHGAGGGGQRGVGVAVARARHPRHPQGQPQPLGPGKPRPPLLLWPLQWPLVRPQDHRQVLWGPSRANAQC